MTGSAISRSSVTTRGVLPSDDQEYWTLRVQT